MTDEEKFKFVDTVLEIESQLYLNGKQYDRQDEFWLHKYITKSNTDGLIRTNLEAVYKTALNLVKGNKDLEELLKALAEF